MGIFDGFYKNDYVHKSKISQNTKNNDFWVIISPSLLGLFGKKHVS